MEESPEIEISLKRLIKLLRKNTSPISIDVASKNETVQYIEEYEKLMNRLESVSPDSLIKRMPSMEQYTPISNSQYSMF